MTLTRSPLAGRLPDSELVTVDTGRNGPQRLHRRVAPLWAAMLTAGMPAGCLTSGYRTAAQTADELARAAHGETPSAAPVGVSWHPEGYAADVAEPARSWQRRWGTPYGLIFDTVPGEPWHVLIDPDLATIDTTHQEVDDMTRDELVSVLRAPEFALFARDRAFATIAGWYLDLLGRPGSPAEITARVKAITDHGSTYADQYAAILGSPEAAAYRKRNA